jgi:hypothetical protein
MEDEQAGVVVGGRGARVGEGRGEGAIKDAIVQRLALFGLVHTLGAVRLL